MFPSSLFLWEILWVKLMVSLLVECCPPFKQHPVDEPTVASEWMVSDQEEELIRLLVVDSDYAEP